MPADVEGGGAGDLLGLALGAAGLSDHERLAGAAAVVVGPAGAAVPGRGARHRVDRSVSARVEGGGAGDLLRLAPSTVGLGDDERLAVACAVGVGPAGAAVPGRGARHRGD